MKILIASICMIITCSTTRAQQELTTLEIKKSRKNEIGLTTELDVFSKGYSSTSFRALQYKRWKNDCFGARFLVGISDYYSDANSMQSFSVRNDTITKLSTVANGSLGFVGLGLEAQRRFYKRVYLFAAVEVKLGVGRASIDTVVETTYDNMPVYNATVPYVQSISPNSASVFQASVSPTFGGKIQFKRICFGSEMSLNIFNYSNINYADNTSVGTTSLELGQINPRFFVHFRF